MIIRPTRQTRYRPYRYYATLGDEHTALASRLTERDRWILRMVHEHRVLTTNQLADLAFPTLKIARRRLLKLLNYQVIDRFRPFRQYGSDPAHWILAPAGAAVIASEVGTDLRGIDYRHERALATAHSLRLAHTVGVNEWFASLVAGTRAEGAGQVSAWWSETRCRRLWGDLAQPDGYGRFDYAGTCFEFFLEYDLGTENYAHVTRKLGGYADLARSTGIVTPVLLWLPTALRETAVRQQLSQSWTELSDPRSVPVATAAADLLDHGTAHPSPADRVWLPLETLGPGRVELHRLPAAWPHVTTVRTTDSSNAQADQTGTGRKARLAPPSPTPLRHTGER